jgi:hypothetical protein
VRGEGASTEVKLTFLDRYLVRLNVELSCPLGGLCLSHVADLPKIWPKMMLALGSLLADRERPVSKKLRPQPEHQPVFGDGARSLRSVRVAVQDR